MFILKLYAFYFIHKLHAIPYRCLKSAIDVPKFPIKMSITSQLTILYSFNINWPHIYYQLIYSKVIKKHRFHLHINYYCQPFRLHIDGSRDSH